MFFFPFHADTELIDEHIVTGSIQLEDLYDNLKELEAREGYCIGAELGAFADGLETSRRLLLEDTDDVED